MYTEADLNKLIADVSKEFQTVFAKSEDESKNKDEAKSSKESGGEPKKPMESEKPEDKGMKDQAQQDMSSKQGDGKMPEDKDSQKEGSQAPSPKDPASEPGHDPSESHGYDDEDMQHMHSMYSSMSKPELKAHHDCIRKCMDGMANSEMAKSEMEDGAKDAEGYRPNGGPHDGEAASKTTPKSSDTQAMTKSEKDFAMESEEIKLLKSELESVKAKSAEDKKAMESALTAFLTKFVEKTAPAGKAITSLDIIAKSTDAQEKPLQKSEIDAKLLAKAKDINLSKSDREAINSYYFSKNPETVRHLLK